MRSMFVGPQAVHIGLPGYGNSLIYLIHNAISKSYSPVDNIGDIWCLEE